MLDGNAVSRKAAKGAKKSKVRKEFCPAHDLVTKASVLHDLGVSPVLPFDREPINTAV